MDYNFRTLPGPASAQGLPLICY